MKTVFTLLCISATTAAFAQPRLMNQAMVTTKTTIVAPDDDEAPQSNSVGANGEEIRVMRFGGDGETTTTTWLKNDLVKTYSESETSRTTVIRDNSKKMTTTIMEMMGRKMGFYASDEDQEQMRKQMDSMMRSRNDAPRTNTNETPTIDIQYLEQTKKIAGYECKRALIISKRGTRSDSTLVWYTPDVKLQGVASTGGALGGFGGMSPALGTGGFDKLEGFPMQYERAMNRGRKMTVQVTKLVIDKEIADKEFEIPKDIEIKAMKDMQTGGGPGNVQIRIGG